LSEPTTPPLTMIGERYRIEREIGRGGMAIVYLCEDLDRERRVAVKVLRREVANAVANERFLREIEFASTLHHPQIPAVLDSGEINGLPYYVMTYLEGESLRAKITRDRQVPIEDAVKIACAVVDPMDYAHQRGILHRDIKPENIILTAEGVYVLDFGVARAIVEAAGDRLTSTGVAIGTPAYMSPEQALGDSDLDSRSDIYALGCVLYEMIAGLPPFVGATPQAVISRRFAAPAARLSEVREGIPVALEHAIAKALAKAPADRWSTAADFGRALAACPPAWTGEQIVAPPAIRRRPWQRIAILPAILVAAGGIFAWTTLHRGALAEGINHIAEWNFSAAESELRRAVAKSPTDARAHLWLAQVLMLQGTPVEEWKSLVLQIGNRRFSLNPADRQRTDALLSAVNGNVDEACRLFGALRKTEETESENIASSLSYADCMRGDTRVVHDAASASGYRFRTSYQAADSVYTSMLEGSGTLAASYAVILPRLEQVLVMHKNQFRRGILVGEEPVRLLALPRLLGDTLAYIPYPVSGSGNPWRTQNTNAIDAALARNGERLRAYALAWIKAAPNDGGPHEMLGRVLEASGDLTGENFSAIAEVRRARMLPPASAASKGNEYLRQVRLGSDQVRLYVKLGSFDKAGALADSLLGRPIPGSLADGSRFAATGLLTTLAALRGRPLHAIELNVRSGEGFQIFLPNGQFAALPRLVIPDAIALSQYAAAGGPRDSILAMKARFSDKLSAVIPAGDLQSFVIGALRRPLTLAASVVGPDAAVELGPTSDPFVLALKGYAEKDIPRAKRYLDSLRELHKDYPPGVITMDVVYGEAWLRSEIGDAEGAALQLDRGLRGLPAALPYSVKSYEVVAALVRAMALRAELAHQAHDSALAKRWADAVLLLWGNGDATTAATVARMREIH
jgi:tRNA A-37 threonylcarbamoyl transferase component Bud32